MPGEDPFELSPKELAELEAEAEAMAGGEPSEAGAVPPPTDDAAGTGEGSPGAEPPELRLRTLSIVGSPLDLLEASGSAHAIDEEALERFEQDDIHRVLRKAPGVYVRGEDGFGLRPNIGIRGVTSDRSKKITLLEDGVLLGPAPYSAPAAYFFPLVTRMTGVEVFKGPSAITHGPQTIGGAVNLLTRPTPHGTEGEIDLSAGMYGYGKAHGHVGFGGEQWGVLLEGVRLHSTGFQDLGGRGARDNTGFHKHELMLKGRYNTPATAEVYQQLDLKLGVATETSYATYLGITLPDFEDDSLQRYAASQRGEMDWWRLQGELTHLLSFNADVELRTTIYRHDFDRVWEKLNRFSGNAPSLDQILKNPGGRNLTFLGILRGEADSDPTAPNEDQVLLVGANDRRYVSQGVQSVLDVRLETGPVVQELQVGARLHYDKVKRDQTEAGYLMTNGVLVPTADPADFDQTALNRGETLAGAVYARDAVAFGPVKVSPGLRVELIQSEFLDRATGERGDRFTSVFIPGLGVYYRVFEELGVLAGVYRGFGHVTPGPHLLEGRGGEVEPETAINYEAGGRFAVARTRLELIGFLSDYDNVIGECSNRTLRPPLCTEDTVGSQFNGGRARTYGLEALASQELSGPAGLTFGLDANYTLTLSEFLDGGIITPDFGEVEPGYRLPYMPVHSLMLGGRVEHARFSLAAAARYVSEMRDVAGMGSIPEDERIDPYLIVDVSAAWHVTAADRFYVNVENLFDRRYIASWRPFGARPGAPFQLQAGYKHSFGD